METLDLPMLSRDVARAQERVLAGAADPFAGLRHVSTQSTYRALVEGEPRAHERLVRDALLRWVHELLQTRIGLELAEAEAEALHRVDPALPSAAARAEAAAVPRTFAEAHRALVTATTARDVATALDRLAELAPPVAAVRRERRARRFEAARRLGLSHPSALAAPASADLAAAARALLEATEDLARDLRRRAKLATAAAAIDRAFARDAREGWPARLGARWLEEAFAALAPRPFRAPALPAALGGASFLRAAASWGRALRLEGTARSLPFVLARDPYPVDAHVFGAALALAVADPVFQKKRLGLGARAAEAQARTLRESLLASARFDATRLLLGIPESVDASLFEELGARAFGAPLPPPLRDAWPAPRVDEPARFVALLRAHGFVRDLVDRFDDDWFVNPKAGAHLAAIAAGPIVTDDAPDAGAPASIARAFESALG